MIEIDKNKNSFSKKISDRLEKKKSSKLFSQKSNQPIIVRSDQRVSTNATNLNNTQNI